MDAAAIAASGRTSCRIDWVMNGLRWPDLFCNLPEGTSYRDAMDQAERRLPLFRRGFREEDHDFAYQIVGAVDQPTSTHQYPFAQ